MIQQYIKGKTIEEFRSNIKNLDKQQQFNMACSYGVLSIVKELINDPDVKVNGSNNFPLQYASKNNHIEIVRLLLTYKEVNPKDSDYLALTIAASNGNLEIVKLLVSDSRISKWHIVDSGAILTASYHRQYNVVKYLLNVIGPSKELLTKLVLKAQSYGDMDMMEYLLNLEEKLY